MIMTNEIQRADISLEALLNAARNAAKAVFDNGKHALANPDHECDESSCFTHGVWGWGWYCTVCGSFAPVDDVFED
jgi:hypothetical protein